MSTISVFRPNSRILSATTSSDLREWLSSHLESGDRHILMDLQHILFMDSTGLGTLVSAQKQVAQSGGKLALCSISGQARMLLETAGMLQLFEIYNSLSEFESNLLSMLERVPHLPSPETLKALTEEAPLRYSITPSHGEFVLRIWEPAPTNQNRVRPFLFAVKYRLPSKTEAQDILGQYKAIYPKHKSILADASY